MSYPTVTVHALDAGHFTLPEKFFVHPSEETAWRTVPSLAFLIQHHDRSTGKVTRIVFDLGLRRQTARYPEAIQKHLATRHPMSTDPDVTKSLAAGGLTPDDIDFVIYSHVHWDHVGEPWDFPRSTFVVGHGALDLLHGKNPAPELAHSVFEADLLSPDRTIQLMDPSQLNPGQPNKQNGADFTQPWAAHVEGTVTCPAIDLFHDGSLYIINAPGHLPGHINLLARTETTAGSVYLAGDACHDRRILRKEREISEWTDAHGHICCIHTDRKIAEETLEQIRQLEAQGVEVILAHDVEWEENNRDRFWGSR
ncbi:hypothetical protein FQN55_003086 [Onygenales sp. PD_40]|nr:hypothetical protein FQN55_003086 [Onygenales sp. PD_40]KAK2783307.1 hypothetical protein FQN53_009295 [Emmonsiellopsis sp. PD_33]KAK2799554.1 hypothetical protein FQN51_006868 [Onygenales sp. PD_10]